MTTFINNINIQYACPLFIHECCNSQNKQLQPKTHAIIQDFVGYHSCKASIHSVHCPYQITHNGRCTCLPSNVLTKNQMIECRKKCKKKLKRRLKFYCRYFWIKIHILLFFVVILTCNIVLPSQLCCILSKEGYSFMIHW